MNLKRLIWLYLYTNLIVLICVNTWPKNKINSRTFNYSSSVSSFHCCDNISLIIGSLLGNSYMRISESYLGIIITFRKCSDNLEYLMWFHLCLAKSGYCSFKKPKLKKIISKNYKVLYTYSIDSYSLPNFYWLYEMFYKQEKSLLGRACASKKVIPGNLKKFLTPLSLATWYLDGTDKLSKLGESSFILTKEDLKYISDILKNKYNLDIIIQLKCKDQVAFYIKNSPASEVSLKAMKNFSEIIKPYFLPSLQHKLKGQHNKLTIWSYNNLANSRSYSTNVKNEKSTMRYKKEYELSIEQKEALIGIILGDGFLEKNKPNHNTRLKIEQSYPEKDKYLRSLYKLLEPLTTMEPTILTRNNQKTGITTQSLYFRTLSMPCLNYYYDLFYYNKKKIIPRNLDELLTARGLAFFPSLLSICSLLFKSTKIRIFLEQFNR